MAFLCTLGIFYNKFEKAVKVFLTTNGTNRGCLNLAHAEQKREDVSHFLCEKTLTSLLLLRIITVW